MNQRFVDFLIATDGEMKKVNWSTARDIRMSTVVVIFASLVLAGCLFASGLCVPVVLHDHRHDGRTERGKWPVSAQELELFEGRVEDGGWGACAGATLAGENLIG